METAFPLKSAETLLSLRLALVLSFAVLAGCTRSGGQAEPGEVSGLASTTSTTAVVPGPASASPAASAAPTPTAAPPASTATAAPTDTATPDPCWQAGGRIELHSLPAEADPQPWDFRVYTPPCYDQQPDRAYPLLILIHGSLFTDAQWDELGADETSDALIGAGEAPPFLILMPRDYKFVAPVRDPFDEALMNRILPWMEVNYRLLPGRENLAIGGLSRGASWAVHLGLQNWELFSAIGAHSLPLFLKDPPDIPGWLEAIPQDMLPRIYLDIGDDDHLVAEAGWFEALLTTMNIPHEWRLNNGRHEEAYWRAHLGEYIAWYAAGW